MGDARDIRTGRTIPTGGGYADQPYIVRTDDGAWLCVMTTARGHEGDRAQHVIATRSEDLGRTWSKPVPIEPPGPPEASYATALKVPGGRIYAFYNHNTDDLREVKADKGVTRRVDTLGRFVFKYSDDSGRTWSGQRHEIPVRETRIDRDNPYGGKVRFFWHVGRPLVHGEAAYVTLHKVGRFGAGFIAGSEGFFLRSDNLLSERDPSRVRWETLPEGDVGLIAPDGGGPIAEEQSLVALADGSLYTSYRTTAGHPACAYSRDGGRSWTKPAWVAYADGRAVRHPRAANFVWRCANGRYLYWFHNHGGRGYEGRNPAWLAGGVEREGRILWSQPEIVLYDAEPATRMSYPDLVEEPPVPGRPGPRYFLTETQKSVARVHELDPAMLEGLWGQFDERPVETRRGVAVEWAGPAPAGAAPLMLPSLATGGGFSVELRVRFEDVGPGQVLFDAGPAGGRGLAVTTVAGGALRLTLNDGRTTAQWDCDAGVLKPGAAHHVVVTVDGGPKVITYVVDGILGDGGSARPAGWGRFDAAMGDVGGGAVRAAPGLRGRLDLLRLYDRPLRTSEAVGNYRARSVPTTRPGVTRPSVR